MDISRLNPSAVTGASSSASAFTEASQSALSFAEVLQAQAKQAELGAINALAPLVDRAVNAAKPLTETSVIAVKAVTVPEKSAADAAATLREWSGASASKKSKNGDSPLALAAHDLSLAGRYDVVAMRDDKEQRGALRSYRV
jgi:hypothetical protein